MALIQPELFSKRFGIAPQILKKAGLLDPILNSDTKLFVDPLLVHKSNNKLIRESGISTLTQRFNEIIDLLDVSKNENDVAWKGAYKALNLDERPETGLGYGGASTTGNSRPPALRHSILRTAKEIITLGEKNPNTIPLMGLFERGVGPDTLSDMTTSFLLPVLCEITSNFSKAEKIPTKKYKGKYGDFELPENPLQPDQPVILVPRDLLRDLPLAVDWSDVSRVIMEIDEIRDAVNRMFGNMAKATVTQKKEALRKVAFSSLKNFKKVLNAVVGASESYDEKADLDGYYTFREILYSDPSKFKGMVTAPSTKTQHSLTNTVFKIVETFKNLVENNNLWELLWHGEIQRHERASQLLFFAVATVICFANNTDISPETNSGGGPVDFKFSTGYRGRVLVELKLSTGSVVHGYKKQLETYKLAAQTEKGVFVVINVGKMGRKLTDIQKLKSAAEADGKTASDILVIDARRRKSASKQ